MNIQIVDNHAYENYQKNQPAKHYATKEVSAVDPFDGEITHVEISICVATLLIVMYAVWRAFKS
jgi:hypothetical protein